MVWRVTIAAWLACVCVGWAGGLKAYKPASVTSGSATVTNAFIQSVNTALGATATTNSYTEAGMPAPVKAVVAVTNGVPYITFGLAPICTNYPTIVGPRYIGMTMTGVVGGWVSTPESSTAAYLWKTNNVVVSGETNTTLALTAPFLNATATFGILQSNIFGVVTNFSAASVAIVEATYRSKEDGSGPATVNGGSGYVIGDVLTVVGGTHTETCRLYVYDTYDGAITGIGVGESEGATTSGVYTVLPENPVSVTGGSGSDATFNLSWELIP